MPASELLTWDPKQLTGTAYPPCMRENERDRSEAKCGLKCFLLEAVEANVNFDLQA